MMWHNRSDLPHLLNELGLLDIGVEVGVLRGENLAHIRQHWKGTMLVGVDAWMSHSGSECAQLVHDANFLEAKARFKNVPNVTLMRGMSLEIANKFTDGLSFVYLDGDHRYETVRDEIAAFWPLIKKGGVLAGHDWIPTGFHVDGDPVNAYATHDEALRHGSPVNQFGVVRAVTERFKPEDIHLTDKNDDNGYRSWLVRKT